MFLLYRNDITTNITSTIIPFADNCVLYHVIHSEQDHHLLQLDLNCITQWTKQWQISLNIDVLHLPVLDLPHHLNSSTTLTMKHLLVQANICILKPYFIHQSCLRLV